MSTAAAPRRTRDHKSKGELEATRKLDGLPTLDADLLDRALTRFEIHSIELVGVHFERRDAAEPLGEISSDRTPEIGIDATWEISKDNAFLGCILTFEALIPDPAPYHLVARFRVVYTIVFPEELTEDETVQFVWWDAMFTVWPEWREYFSSTLRRANLPAVTLPLLPYVS